MKSFKMLLFFCLLIHVAYRSNAQNCINNTLSSKSLTLIPKESISFTYKGSMVNVTISKGGTGPGLSPYNEYNEYNMEGVWIGQNNTWADNTDISLSSSKPITIISFDLWALNNDESGEEQIKNIRVYDTMYNDISDKVEIAWLTGNASNIKSSKSQATTYETSTKTIKAKPGFCCEAASGTLKINSNIPFSKITFRHEEMNYMFSTANGVVLGNLNLCVTVPPQIITKTEIQKINSPAKTKSDVRPSEGSTKNLAAKKVDLKETTVPPLPKNKELVLNNVHFEIGTAILLQNSYSDLDQLVQVMKEMPNMKIELHGHTDNLGKQEINLKLSEDRVDVVRRYLISKGIAAERIKGKGFGGMKPLIQGDSEEIRMKNRRVEFVIISD